jgi:predicted permease
MRRFFLKLLRRRRLDRDLQTELAFHREMAAVGANPIPLGNAAVIREQAFDLWRFNFIEDLWRDLVYAARGLRRSPALVLTALVSLGLGIGVNTALFSLGVGFLLSQPSVRDPGSVVAVRVAGNSNLPEKVIRFIQSSGLFEDVAGEDPEAFANYNDGSQTSRVFAVFATKNYFTALGVPMLYGRGFAAGDPDEVTVVSNGFWRKRLSGDPAAIGRTINLDGRLCTVVGILPEGHRTLVGFGFSPDVYLPAYLEGASLAMYARLKPGVSLAEARAGLLTVAKRMDESMPERSKYARGVSVSHIGGSARLREQTEMLAVGLFFALLLAVAGLVLSIACVNVASLLLARASARRRELAIRLALGAGRGRLMQQFLAESLLLSLLGAGFGLALAQITATLLAAVELPLPLPLRFRAAPDWRVAIYAALLTAFAVFACGLLPAWQSLRESIATDLHREGRMRLRRTLVAAQIAVSVVVLATGFLFLRNLMEGAALSPGFDLRRTVRADVYLPPSGFSDPQKKTAYISRALDELAAVPGIERVAAARLIPFTDNTSYGSPITFADNHQMVQAFFKWNAVTPEFFQAMGIPIRQGRTFSDADAGGKTVIVNTTFVRRYLGGRQPIGTVFLWGAQGKTPYRIVGVAEGTKTMTIGEEQQPQLYEPLAQIVDDRLRIQFVMRSAIPPALQLNAVRGVLHGIEPMAGAQVETMFSSIGLAFVPSQVGAALLGSMGLLGLALAMTGLYGVMAYSVARRTREIGVRIALGATRGDISRMVLRESAGLTVGGCAAGLAIALFVTRPLAMFLAPGLKPADPLSFAAVALVMLLTGLSAAVGPVRRAITVDPNAALRED